MNQIEKTFRTFEDRIEKTWELEKDQTKNAASLIGDVVKTGGIVQLFGVAHGEEFVNELFFRAGGLAPFHAIRPIDLALEGKISRDIIDSGEIYQSDRYLSDLEGLYDMDDRDMYLIVSSRGNEPLAVAMAEKAHEKGQKLIAVVNRRTADKADGKNIMDHADLVLDMTGDDPDYLTEVNGIPVGQMSSTLGNIVAQMVTADLYAWYLENNLEPPVLLSANIAGADKHNAALTDVYGRRVR